MILVLLDLKLCSFILLLVDNTDSKFKKHCIKYEKYVSFYCKITSLRAQLCHFRGLVFTVQCVVSILCNSGICCGNFYPFEDHGEHVCGFCGLHYY